MQPRGKQFGDSNKLHTCYCRTDTAIPLLSVYPKEVKQDSNGSLHTIVLSIPMHNS